MIFIRGVQVRLTKKKALTTFFFSFFFVLLVLSLFYRKQLVNFKEIYNFSRFQRGSNIFQGGGGFQLFPGGGGVSNCFFPIETHITCDFPGGSGPPIPLWIRTWEFLIRSKDYVQFGWTNTTVELTNRCRTANEQLTSRRTNRLHCVLKVRWRTSNSKFFDALCEQQRSGTFFNKLKNVLKSLITVELTNFNAHQLL